MMELYEIMLIVSPELGKEEHDEVLGDLKSVIKKQRGTLSTILDWRKRRLAYEINKLQEGHYYLVYFSGPGTIIPEIEHYFRVTDAVIRYMIVRTDEQEFALAAEKASKEAAAEKVAMAAETLETKDIVMTEVAEEPEAEEPAAEEPESEEPEAEEPESEEPEAEETEIEEPESEEPAAEEPEAEEAETDLEGSVEEAGEEEK